MKKKTVGPDIGAAATMPTGGRIGSADLCSCRFVGENRQRRFFDEHGLDDGLSKPRRKIHPKDTLTKQQWFRHSGRSVGIGSADEIGKVGRIGSRCCRGQWQPTRRCKFGSARRLVQVMGSTWPDLKPGRGTVDAGRASAAACRAPCKVGLSRRQPSRARQRRPASPTHAALVRLRGWEEMEEGSRGFPSPENSRDFFKNQPTRMKAKRGKLRGK